jgi:fluoroquinolone resistance protein
MSHYQEIQSQVFTKESYVRLDLKHKIFAHVTFKNCDFTECDLRGARLQDCKFLSCNLSLVKLDGTRLQDIDFEECKFVGVNFTKCDPLFLSFKFTKCLIETSNFSDLDLKGTCFDHSILKETHFSNTNLARASFVGADLKESAFHNTNLTQTNFKGAINYSINPLTNKLSKAQFSNPEVLALLQYLDIIVE